MPFGLFLWHLIIFLELVGIPLKEALSSA